ncbi:MAG TPA: PAS domain S-box protein [Polyangiaceae bacterium]|jgi:anti-anti-sigma factor|nr:PAS domain S-box protein [Polyangiaceae bacterium]
MNDENATLEQLRGELSALRARALELEASEAQRKAAEAHLRRLLELSGDMVRVYTPEGVCVYASPSCKALMGYEPEELLGQKGVDLTHPDDVPLVQKAMVAILEEPSAHTVSYRMRAKDGRYVWVESVATTVRDPETGAVREIVLVVRDVTARKQVEAALSEREARVRSLLESLDVGVLVQGPSTEILMSNLKALELLDLTKSQIIGKTSFDPSWNVIREDGSAFPAEMHPISEAIRTRLPVQDVLMGVYRPNLKDRVWILVNATPELGPDGSLKQVVCTVTDVTARKEAENELARARDAMFAEMATPLIPISDDVMVMPLVGAMDTRRAKQVLDALLPGITERRARVAIVDITGVRSVDAQVVSALVGAAQAVRLLGAEMVLTGIRPSVAQVLVNLGVSTAGIVTRSTLQSGIAYALGRR